MKDILIDFVKIFLYVVFITMLLWLSGISFIFFFELVIDYPLWLTVVIMATIATISLKLLQKLDHKD